MTPDPEDTISTNHAGKRAAAARDGRLAKAETATVMLTTAQHTPGPWTVEGGLTGLKIETAEDSIAAMSGFNRNAEADARLIAAAPEMLEALREAEAAALAVNRGAGETVFNPAALAIIRAAIAKATGGKL